MLVLFSSQLLRRSPPNQPTSRSRARLAPGDEHDFLFDLTRAVGSVEDLRFVGYSQIGGTNAAGDVIAGSNLDTDLSLFDGADALRGRDRTSAGPDALLSWPSVSLFALLPLNPDPLPVDNYRLNLQAGPAGPSVEAFSVDLIGPADAIVYTGDMAINNSTLTSFRFGSATDTATYRLSGDLTNTITLDSQFGGVIEGNGPNGGATLVNGSPGRTITSSHEILSAVGSVWNLTGGQGGSFANGGRGGSIVIDGGTATLAGDANLRGGAQGPGGSSSDSGGAGGSISLADSDATLSSVFDLSASRFAAGGSVSVSSGSAVLSGSFNQMGGVGTQQRVAGDGGTLSVSGGNADLSGEFDLIGGSGGFATTSGGDAGRGGNLSVTGGVANLIGNINLIGGRGGNANGGRGGDGGLGGNISISGGVAILTGSLSLDGGDGGAAFFGSFGGNGGSVSITAGELRIEGGSISQAGGEKFGGSGGGIGSNGSVSVTGGTLTLDTGTILGRTGAASTDPLTLARASLAVSDTGQVNLLNDMTVGVGGVVNVTGGDLDATPTPAASQSPGENGRRLTNAGALTFTGGAVHFDGGAGGDTSSLFTIAGAGGRGGEIVATGGSLAIGGTADVSFDGGAGGSVFQDAIGGEGGAGGELVVGVNTTISGSAVVSLGGGDGGNGDTNLAGLGGRGGLIQVNAGGSVVQSGLSQVLLHGGVGGAGSDTSDGNGGDGGTVVTNGGTYTLQDAAVLSLRGGAAGSGNPGNAGQIEVSQSDFIMNGGIVYAGTIIETAGDFDFNGGTLSVAQFSGTLDQDGGTLAPGDSPGLTNISGDYNLNAGVVEIELFGDGGVAGTDHDQVSVVGTATLGGELLVDIDSGFTPQSADAFIVLTAGTLVGTFANVGDGGRVGTLGGLGSFVVSYDSASNQVVLADFLAGPFLAGDYNADGVVDAADYTLWRDNLGASPGTLVNDANGGVIGATQYATWRANFGNTLPPAAVQTTGVPEPASVALCGLLAALLFGVRRR